ncbi:MAG: sodium:proton antiporter [Alphaproteobacteria bacterium]|nr:sodium:proton antiporter [Alphaproteobacteria bacterium]
MGVKIILLTLGLLLPAPLLATGGNLSGQDLSLWWGLPFVGMLLSLAFMPLLAVHIWENHYGKIALLWSLMTICTLINFFGIDLASKEVAQTFFHHYLPFIIIISALYTISGGIKIDIQSPGTPLMNTALMGVGTFLAGWIGTTGAAMLLVRPLLHINEHRKARVHHMIFFIFLVGNVGGILTPLGDPPLFLGFLNGVDFFWPLEKLAFDLILITAPLLLLFYGLDSYFTWKEGHPFRHRSIRIILKGKFNGLLFIGVIGLVLMSGIWQPAISLNVGGVSIELANFLRDGGLILLALASWFFTPSEIHKENHFSWEPLKEVAKLFFGIFMTVIPVISILAAGHGGALAPVISLVEVNGEPNNMMYFWLTGGLSSFLDNAPTYLVFFHMAGGEATRLMTTLTHTLEAISLGAVFLGAMTYIGNAPNFMVKAIAEGRKVAMPSFFGYMAWSAMILLPLFVLLSLWRF